MTLPSVLPWAHQDSNLGPADYGSAAFTFRLERCAHAVGCTTTAGFDALSLLALQDGARCRKSQPAAVVENGKTMKRGP